MWRELILLFYRMPPIFLGLLEDPAAREGMQSLLQGRVYEPRDLDTLAVLQVRALELGKRCISPLHANERKAERVMQHTTPWRDCKPLAEDSFAFGVAIEG